MLASIPKRAKNISDENMKNLNRYTQNSGNYKKQLHILSKSTKDQMHPGHSVNIQYFWPKFLSEITDNLYILSSSLIYEWPNNKIFMYELVEPMMIKYYHFDLKNFKKNVNITNPNKRFLYITLVIVNNKTNNAHANGLLYDFQKKQLEGYEPHGYGVKLEYAQLTGTYIKKKMKEYLEKTIGIEIKKFIQPKSISPCDGFQMLQEYNKLYSNKYENFNKKYEIGGYCAVWTMYYVYIRVLFPDVKQKDLVGFIIQRYKHKMDRIIHEFYFYFIKYKSVLLH